MRCNTPHEGVIQDRSYLWTSLDSLMIGIRQTHCMPITEIKNVLIQLPITRLFLEAYAMMIVIFYKQSLGAM